MVGVNAKGDNFAFSQGLSLMIECDDQADRHPLTKKLLEGGAKQEDCGWVRRSLSVSRGRSIPKMLREVMEGKDDAKADRMVHAVFHMKKLDIAELKRAAHGN